MSVLMGHMRMQDFVHSHTRLVRELFDLNIKIQDLEGAGGCRKPEEGFRPPTVAADRNGNSSGNSLVRKILRTNKMTSTTNHTINS